MPWKKRPKYRTMWDEYESEKKEAEEKEKLAHMTRFQRDQLREQRDLTKHKAVTVVIIVLVLAFIAAAIITSVRHRTPEQDPFAQQTRYPSAWERGGDGQEG